MGASDRSLGDTFLLKEFDLLFAHFDTLRCEEIAIATKDNHAAITRARKVLSEISKACIDARKELLARGGRLLKERRGEKEGDEDMEKYGVDEGGCEKIAEEGKEEEKAKITCPKCGSPTITVHGNVRICDTCGSLPFEK
jgi:ribosomal protein S27AE